MVFVGCWGNVLAGESATMLGCWRRRGSIGTSLRRSTVALAHAAHSQHSVKVGVGSGTSFAWLMPQMAKGKVGGGAAALALLALLGLYLSAMAGC